MSYPSEKWNFQPHPVLANGHAQTVLGIRWPRLRAPYQAVQHQVPLDDGDRLVIHEDRPEKGGDAQDCVLLIHGLAGCHQSSYMCRIAERLAGLGYRVFRMDMRGCGAGEGLAKLPTHTGRSSDIVAALHCIAELYPEATTNLVGFSLGGSQALNMLAEAGEIRVGNLERSLVVCPPLDLAAVELHFRTLSGWFYDKFFVRLLWKQIVNRWQRFPENAPESIPRRPRCLREIDEMVIAPTGGFESAADYYAKTSPGPKLAAIRQPVTILSSEDDPVVPVGPLLELPRSSSVQVITTSHGGHLGFLARRNGDPDGRWLDWRIIDWLDGKGKADEKRKGEKRKIEVHVAQRTVSSPTTAASTAAPVSVPGC